MGLVDSFTWGLQVGLSGFQRAKFAPAADWAKSYGVHADRELLYGLPDYDPRHSGFDVPPFMSGTEPTRRWMAERNGWDDEVSIASGAKFAKEIWMNGLGCNAAAPGCPSGPDVDRSWQCHSYGPGQDAAWCRAAGNASCWEYAEGVSAGCGCGCCRRRQSLDLAGPERQCCVLFSDLTLSYTVTADLGRCAPKEPASTLFVLAVANVDYAAMTAAHRTAFAREVGEAVRESLGAGSYDVEVTLSAGSVRAAVRVSALGDVGGLGRRLEAGAAALAAAVVARVTTIPGLPTTGAVTAAFSASAPAPDCPGAPPMPAEPAVAESLRWGRERLAGAETDYAGRGLSRMPSPASWDKEVAYSVTIDRFANGDISNDRANLPDLVSIYLFSLSLYIYIYMYICMYIYIYIYIYVYIYIYTHVYIYIYMYVYIYTYIYTFIYSLSLSLYIYIYICTYTHHILISLSLYLYTCRRILLCNVI